MTKKQLFASLKKSSWKSLWAGGWGMLSITEYGLHYIHTLRVGRETMLPKVAFLYCDGKSSAWADERDIQSFSDRVARALRKNSSYVTSLVRQGRKEVNRVLSILDDVTAREPSWTDYMRYVRAIHAYYVVHVQMKYVVDALTASELKRYLPKLEELRVYAESVFEKTKEYEHELCKKIGKEEGYDRKHLRALVPSELKNYFERGKLPRQGELKKRYVRSALYIDKTHFLIITGNETKAVEKVLRGGSSSKELKGQCAYPGTVEGRVQAVLDLARHRDFVLAIFS